MQRRFAPNVELRAKGRKLAGYAAVFGVRAQIGAFAEVILPGAFSASLSGAKDILALVDHDPTRLLARTRAETLRLSQDARGLQFEIDVPQTSLGSDILALAEGGNLGGASIGFSVSPGGEDWRDGVRQIRAIDLHEISIVQAFAAYPETTVAARARGARLSVPFAKRVLEVLRLSK